MSRMSTELSEGSIHRRSFLRKGAFAAAGTLCVWDVGMANAAHEDSGHRTAVDFIANYSDNIVILNSDAGVTRMVARVRDVPGFCEAIFRARAAGISELRVARTLATFRAGGRVYEVENLLHHDFARFKFGNLAARIS